MKSIFMHALWGHRAQEKVKFTWYSELKNVVVKIRKYRKTSPSQYIILFLYCCLTQILHLPYIVKCNIFGKICATKRWAFSFLKAAISNEGKKAVVFSIWKSSIFLEANVFITNHTPPLHVFNFKKVIFG